MTRLLTRVLLLLLVAAAFLFGGLWCGMPILGATSALVPTIMTLLIVFDWFEEAERECLHCCRSEEFGRLAHVDDWFAGDDGNCVWCQRPLVRVGDRIFGAGS